MNRNERRRVHKLTGQEIKDIRRETLSNAINFTLRTVYEVMGEEFGFGSKRLDRLEKGILEKLESTAK